MQWSDDAIVLSVRPHGETSAIVTVLARHQGRCAGLVKGARSRQRRAAIQPGNLVNATWRGRLAEHLGNFDLELRVGYAARAMTGKSTLAALVMMSFYCETLAERDPHPELFDAFADVMRDFESRTWLNGYVYFEALFLQELGIGLDLSECAATGTTDDLTYISPKSGRAVSAAAGAPYRNKLLPLPSFLRDGSFPRDDEINPGLAVTGHFLERYMQESFGNTLPAVRNDILAETARLRQ